MKRVIILPLIFVFSIASVSAPSLARPMPTDRFAPLLAAYFVPCTPDLCGGFEQNSATISVRNSQVTVLRSGLVNVQLVKARYVATGQVAASYTFQVRYGQQTTGVSVTTLLGTITTDDSGNFNGPIDAGGGVKFSFAPGSMSTGLFFLNTPEVRSEFITGLSIPH